MEVIYYVKLCKIHKGDIDLLLIKVDGENGNVVRQILPHKSSRAHAGSYRNNLVGHGLNKPSYV